MDKLPALATPDPAPEIAALAARWRRANGPMMTFVNRIGGSIENRFEALPDGVKQRIEAVVRIGLDRAYDAARIGANAPRMNAPKMNERAHRAVASLTGAAGGMGGLPTAIAELPVTIAVIFHAIQRVAEDHGFDPASPATRAECLRVFSAGSPLAEDDGVNTSFLGARMTITGPALNRLIATIAPKVAATLGPKLAAQSVPVMGALAGASVNFAFVSYYQELAHVRFGLMKLMAQHDPALIASAFARQTAQLPPKAR